MRWFSSAEDIAAVDTNGTITARSTGSAIITASTADGSLTSSCTVEVRSGVAVTGISFADGMKTVTKSVGDVFMADYTITPAEAANKNVTWSSDNPSVVSVNENRRLEARAVGTATITVKAMDGGLSDTMLVQVVPGEGGDGFDYVLRALDPQLAQSQSNLSGSIAIRLENRTAAAGPVTVCIAVYEGNKRMECSFQKNISVVPGINTIIFDNLLLKTAAGSGYSVKCFVWDSSSFTPLARNMEREIPV